MSYRQPSASSLEVGEISGYINDEGALLKFYTNCLNLAGRCLSLVSSSSREMNGERGGPK